MHRWLGIAGILVLLFLSACGGGGSGHSESTPVSAAEQKRLDENAFVYGLMKDSYLWYVSVPTVDYARYSSCEALLEDLVYKYDRWSYITSQQEFYDYFEEGVYVGLGYGLTSLGPYDYRISFVFPGSPADRVGIKRGDKLLAINGISTQDIVNKDLGDTIYGETKVGTPVSVTIKDQQGVDKTLHMTMEAVTISPVLQHSVIPLNNGAVKVGYMLFMNFIDTARPAIQDAFTDFQGQGANALIVDLRYNGGGSLDLAQELAYLIVGEEGLNHVFLSLVHNDRYSRYNEQEIWSTLVPSYHLDIDKVVFITTADTCSASEALINGLEPYMNVVQVGGCTCGKPVGMYVHEFSDKVILPIEFRVVNANGVTDYFNGLIPDVNAGDDLEHTLGDPAEASLAAALAQIYPGADTAERGVFFTSIEAEASPAPAYRALSAPIPTKIKPRGGFRQEVGAF